jgi:hypothetical protein
MTQYYNYCNSKHVFRECLISPALVNVAMETVVTWIIMRRMYHIVTYMILEPLDKIQFSRWTIYQYYYKIRTWRECVCVYVYNACVVRVCIANTSTIATDSLKVDAYALSEHRPYIPPQNTTPLLWCITYFLFLQSITPGVSGNV